MIPAELIQSLTGALSLVGVKAGVDVAWRLRRHPPDTDGTEWLTDPDGREIVADMVARPSRRTMLRTWEHVQARAAERDAVPVLVVPRLSRSLRELADAERINWVDAAGNARVVHPPLVLRVEGRPPTRTPLGRSTDPFSPRSTNVVRQLLVEPGRAWRQKELVERTGISQSQTSKALSGLEGMALVERDEQGAFVVADPAALLDAWADAYRYGRQRIFAAHLSGDGIALAQDLHGRLDDAGCQHWFTGLPAAWAYDRFARFRLVSVFVDGDPAAVCRQLALREAPRGANVHLIATDGQRVDLGAARPEDLPCAHPAQVYVDLLGLPERASEAADHLRPLALGEPPT